MAIEQSHGKARPTLPRASDLQAVPAVPERARNHDERGRAAPGNTLARGRGWKTALRRMLGKGTTDAEAIAVADDAWRLFVAMLGELPHDGPIVRSLAMRKARHDALGAFWSARAALVGLATEEGIKCEERATVHGQRAERLTVTAIDVATRLAKARADAGADVDPLDAFMPKKGADEP